MIDTPRSNNPYQESGGNSPYHATGGNGTSPYQATGDNAPYDPYIPAGGSVPGGSGSPSGPAGGVARQGDQRTAALQAEIDSTVGIMRDNINKVTERGANLDTLRDKSDDLAVSAQGFRRGANRVRKQMWWKDMKWRIIVGVGICILIIVIVVPIVKALQGK